MPTDPVPTNREAVSARKRLFLRACQEARPMPDDVSASESAAPQPVANPIVDAAKATLEAGYARLANFSTEKPPTETPDPEPSTTPDAVVATTDDDPDDDVADPASDDDVLDATDSTDGDTVAETAPVPDDQKPKKSRKERFEEAVRREAEPLAEQLAADRIRASEAAQLALATAGKVKELVQVDLGLADPDAAAEGRAPRIYDNVKAAIETAVWKNDFTELDRMGFELTEARDWVNAKTARHDVNKAMHQETYVNLTNAMHPLLMAIPGFNQEAVYSPGSTVEGLVGEIVRAAQAAVTSTGKAEVEAAQAKAAKFESENKALREQIDTYKRREAGKGPVVERGGLTARTSYDQLTPGDISKMDPKEFEKHKDEIYASVFSRR